MGTPVTTAGGAAHLLPSSVPTFPSVSPFGTGIPSTNSGVGTLGLGPKPSELHQHHYSAASALGAVTSGMSSLPPFNPYMRPAFNPAGMTSAVSSGGGNSLLRHTNPSLLQSSTGIPPGAQRSSSGSCEQSQQIGNHAAGSNGGQPAGSPGSGLVGSGQRLKVEDALSYLDQVKVVFATRAQVYSDFLDIMKDFKSQAIDTPGVIQRVSTLFRGHPSLIVGFNTFLPPGYRIDVDSTGERVSICTPTGQSHIIAPAPGPEGAHKMEMTTSMAPAVSSSPLSGGQFPDTIAQQQQNVSPRPPAPGGPPIEFNHAISYVNKIKGRFQHKPEVYKQFLEILHSYQKEQRDIKSVFPGSVPVSHKPLTESAVYASVARLFVNEEDLLREFSQFLPDANGPGILSSLHSQLSAASLIQVSAAAAAGIEPENLKEKGEKGTGSSPKQAPPLAPAKRPALPSLISPKRLKKSVTEISYPVSFTEAAKYGTLSEYQFFDKVRKALKSDEVYENFLRCLVLFNQELIGKAELLDLVQPFIGKYPELFKWLKDFMGCNKRVGYVETVPQKMVQQERISSDLAMEIDYASCKRFGVSYRALPDSYVRPKCCGRTELCDSVLNNVWVSFPSWSSEDTSFVSSKKSQYEEFIYRTEDERFELDIVIEVNKSAIQNLECVRRRMSRMNQEEAKKFRLDENLGGRSAALMNRAIRRIYGEKSTEIIDGLNRNPSVAVPLVLKRLKTKDEEWREAQKGFNRIWRDQNEKYYLKSLDHQAITFKQTDLKNIRSKALLNHIEVLYDERHEKMEDEANSDSGSHISVKYPDIRTIFYDVNDLLIHHVKRQTAVQKEEKSKIKTLLRQKLPDLFGLQREELSDDEDDGDSGDDDEEKKSRALRNKAQQEAEKIAEATPISPQPLRKGDVKVPCGYSLVVAPNSLYVFLRLHQFLCERLGKLKQMADEIVRANQEEERKGKGPSVAALLKCQPKLPCPPDQFYSSMIGQIKNLLDGQIDNSQFEDNLREMFSTSAYIAFTADKLIQNMVRQLQQMVSDDLSVQSQHLWNKWKSLGGAGGLAYSSIDRQEQEAAYQAEAEQLFTDNNAFKIFIYYEEGKVTFELLDTDSCEEENGQRKEWSLYMQYFLDTLPPGISEAFSADFLKQRGDKPVFLYRNSQKVKQLNDIKLSEEKSEPKVEEDSATVGSTDSDSTEKGSDRSGNGKPVRNVVKEEGLEIQLVAGQWGLKFVSQTADLLWKKGAVTKSQMKHEEVYSKRKKRFTAIHKKLLDIIVANSKTEADSKWFREAGTTISETSEGRFSDKFSYLTFCKYTTKQK